MDNQRIGPAGEALAEDFLKRRGCRILQRNFRSRWGEVDLIVRDGPTVCFVEVKTRSSDRYGLPLEAVSHFKKTRLIKTALYYLQLKGWGQCAVRFDVIGIELRQDDVRMEWVKNAFDAQ